MDSFGDFALDSETYEKILAGESLFELFAIRLLEPNQFKPWYYLEVGSKKRSNKKSKNPFAILCLRSKPSANQCISHRPDNYLELYGLLLDKLALDLDTEIYRFIQNCYKRKDVGKSYLGKHLIVVICIPRLNTKGEISIHELVVFHISQNLGEIGLSIGCLKQQAIKKEKRYIYVLQKDFVRIDDKLRKIKVLPFKVIKPFTKQIANAMADISEDMTNNSISVIGVGALGSQLTLNLVRQGFSDWRLIDDDILLPHNFARHGLSAIYRGDLKTEVLKQREKRDVLKAPVKTGME